MTMHFHSLLLYPACNYHNDMQKWKISLYPWSLHSFVWSNAVQSHGEPRSKPDNTWPMADEFTQD